jgi:phosphohistidine phosphatase
MKLFLVRHGEYISSEWDPDQPLSEKGIKETRSVANWLKGLHLEIDEIRHSVKKRAKETAEIFARALSPQCEAAQTEGLKPMDPIEPILEEIQETDQQLMFVGHLPFMEKLLTVLLFGEERECPIVFCPSCVVCLEGEGRHWKIAWVLSPKCANDFK